MHLVEDVMSSNYQEPMRSWLNATNDRDPFLEYELTRMKSTKEKVNLNVQPLLQFFLR